MTDPTKIVYEDKLTRLDYNNESRRDTDIKFEMTCTCGGFVELNTETNTLCCTNCTREEEYNDKTTKDMLSEDYQVMKK